MKQIIKNKNKNFFLLISVFVFLIVAIFLINQESQEEKHSNTDILNNSIYNATNWKYSIDTQNWFEYDNSLSYQDIKKSNIIWLSATLPDVNLYSPALFIYTIDLYYEIFFNGNVYSFTNNEQNLGLNKKTGTNWNIFPLPLDFEDNNLLIKVYKKDIPFTNFEFYLTYSNSYKLFQQVLEMSILKTIFSSIFLALGIVLFTTIFNKNQISHPFYLHGVTSIVIAIAIFAGFNPLSHVAYENQFFWKKLEAVSLFHISLTYMMYLQFSLKQFDKFITLYLHLHLLITFIINLLNYIGDYNIITVEGYFFYFLVTTTLLFFSIIIYKLLTIIKNNEIKGIKNKIKNFISYSWLPIITMLSNIFNYIAYASYSSSPTFILNSYYEWIILLYFCIIAILFILFLRRVSENYTNANYLLIQRQILIKNLINSQNTLMNTKEYEPFAKFLLNEYINIIFPSINTLKYNDHYLNVFTKKQISLDDFAKYNILKNISAFIAINKYNDEFENESALKIVYANGKYKSFEGLNYYDAFSKKQHDFFINSADNKNIKDEITLLIKIEDNLEVIIHFSGFSGLNSLKQNTLKTFLTNSSTILKNLILINKMYVKQKETILGLSEISEIRSRETGNHIRRVSYYSKILAQKLNLPKEDINSLFLASTMHDIGKLAIPDNILHKRGKLTDEEFTLMKEHAKIGYKMLTKFDGKLMNMASIIALEHHEKYDGSGYYGKSGEDINIYGRIVAVADVFDALGSKRAYKNSWALEDILELFKKEKGKHFDPILVDILFDNLDEFLKIRNKFVDQ